MKKLVAILCVVALLGALATCLCACGEETTITTSQDEQWRYQIKTDQVTVSDSATVAEYQAKGYTITAEKGKKTTLQREYYSLVAYLGNDAEVEVPATVDGHTIEALESGLFMRINDGSTSRRMRDVYDVNETLTKVTFACDVEAIPAMCFYLCENLAEVVLPNVQSIGDFAFFGCKALTSIDIPSSVRSIGEYTFRECSALQTVTIHNSADEEFAPYIGAKCFYLVNDKNSGEDQYYIVPDLKIYVANIAVFDPTYIHAAFKANKNNDYRNWLDYDGDDEEDPCYVYDLTTQKDLRTWKEENNG